MKLIDRSKRPLVLTPQGKVYYEGCKDLVERYLELENRVKALEDEDTVAGTVGVAAIYSVGLHHMSQYVKTFEQRHPQANVRLEYLHPSRVLERVTSGEAELGLLSYPAKWPELSRADLARGGDGAGVHPSHRFAGRSSVSVSELDGEPFVAFDPTSRSGGRSTGSCGITRSRSTSCWSSTTSRTSSAPSRSRRASRSCPSHRWLARSRPGRWSPCRSMGDGARRPSDPPAGDHPPAARQPRSGGGEVPGVADQRRCGDRDGARPTRTGALRRSPRAAQRERGRAV